MACSRRYLITLPYLDLGLQSSEFWSWTLSAGHLYGLERPNLKPEIVSNFGWQTYGGYHYMVTPDPEKRVTGSSNAYQPQPQPRVLLCSESPFPGSWGHQRDIPRTVTKIQEWLFDEQWANDPMTWFNHKILNPNQTKPNLKPNPKLNPNWQWLIVSLLIGSSTRRTRSGPLFRSWI